MFRVYFNRRRQWIDVYMEDVSLSTFVRHDGGRWAWTATCYENPRRGLFAEQHYLLCRFRHDTVAHENLHTFLAWVRATERPISVYNEEYLCERFDELTRAWWREHGKSSG